MPEFTWPSANVTHYDFRRSARQGVSLILVDIWCEEVRITGTSQFTQTKTPSGADNANGGAVQTMVPTNVQSNSLPAGAPT